MSIYQRVEFACAIALFAAIVVLVGVASVARYVGSPIIWSIEISQLLFVWLVMLSADLALQHNRHFGLSILLDHVFPLVRRIIETINLLVLIVLLTFLLYHAVNNTILQQRRLVGATQFSAALIHAAMPFGILLMLRTLAVQLWQHIFPGKTA